MDHSNDPSGDGATVLYVEDHEVNVLLMQAVFEHRPQLQLVVATTGAEALRRAAGMQPMLMMLDLNLPDCHGSQLLPMLRQLPGCCSAPAVAVTADHQFDIAGTGFDELWPKPLDLPFLFKRLDGLAAQRWAAPPLVLRSVSRAQTLPTW